MAADQVALQLKQQGYALVEDILNPEQLDMVRMECELVYELAQEGGHSASASGSRGSESKTSCVYEGVPGHLCTPAVKSCYDVYKLHRTKPPLGPGVWRLMFQSVLTELVLGILGPEAALFNDQYIIKPPLAPLSSFSWHRDSDWCRTAEATYHPYISVWIALDDMSPDNGCFVVKPGSHLRPPTPPPTAFPGRGTSSPAQRADPPGSSSAGAAEQPTASDSGGHAVSHSTAAAAERTRCPRTPAGLREQQCHEGQQPEASSVAGAANEGRGEGSGEVPALPLCVRAGTAVITSDTVLHCSGANLSRHVRRAWMPQFSAGPITWREGGQPVGLVIPLQLPQSPSEQYGDEGAC